MGLAMGSAGASLPGFIPRSNKVPRPLLSPVPDLTVLSLGCCELPKL